MNEFMKILLSLSVSGTLLLLLILGLKQLYKNKFSRCWQYYIWVIVALRFLLPFTSNTTMVGSLFKKFDATAITNEISTSPNASVSINIDNSKAEPIQENKGITAAPMHKPFDIYVCLFFVWSALALVLFVRKITIYQGFIQYIKAGNTEISDIKILNVLSDCEEKLNIKTRVELSYNSLITSPMMIGFFHPRIVLPVRELEDRELSYIIKHELIHHKRKDMFYKWLIQIVVCVHWFNPFAYLLEKEVNKSCELSCDEKVISVLDDKARREYGDTLISFLKSNNLCKSSFASVTLTEGAGQLKERLGAIMEFKKKSKTVIAITTIFSIAACACFFVTGAYAASPAITITQEEKELVIKTAAGIYEENLDSSRHKTLSSRIAQYYEADSLPLFGIAFSRLDGEAQREWLEKFYSDRDFAFFSVAVNGLDFGDALIAEFSEKAYTDGEIALFSTLIDCMDEKELDIWLDRALEDGNWSFQSMLFDKLGKYDELDVMEKEWEKQQWAEYQAVGVTKNGKNYYYKDELVNIFLDQRFDNSFYTLDINPKGVVNIRVIRNKNNEIAGISYMTDEEVIELLGE